MKAVIFDFDGLMVDTEVPEYESWREVYRQFGLDLALERWVECIGTSSDAFDPLAHLEELLGRPVEREKVLATKRQRYLDWVHSQPLLPGVAERIEEARAMGLKLGVASSSSRDWVESHLARHDILHHFDCIRTRDDVCAVKPSPELFLSVATALAVPPAGCLVFEDSAHGVLAAKRAGMYCVAVPNTLTRILDLSLADLQVPSLAAISLPELLERVCSDPKVKRDEEG
ncbi:MAG: HAD family hydrolase [Nitrospinota bacterium]|nr:MAG: HAD family hydrolase [Nitrospinota bacterium]